MTLSRAMMRPSGARCTRILLGKGGARAGKDPLGFEEGVEHWGWVGGVCKPKTPRPEPMRVNLRRAYLREQLEEVFAIFALLVEQMAGKVVLEPLLGGQSDDGRRKQAGRLADNSG